MSDISDMFQEMVREHGDSVEVGTVACTLWKADHENCEGCEHELGCSKAVAMLGISLTPMMYQPKSYEDYENMHKSIQRKLDAILKATTVEDVKDIEW